MPSQKEHEQDILLVKNIDTDCHHVDQEVRDVVSQVVNPYTEEPVPGSTNREQVIEEWDHSRGFKVKWGMVPQIILPGATKRMPRYLAEHYAKHLADHMLLKNEKPLNSPERLKILKDILVSVDEYYLAPETLDAGTAALREVERLNAQEQSEPRETVINEPYVSPMIGVIKEEKKTVKNGTPMISHDDTPATAPGKNPPATKEELLKECDTLGLEYNDSMSRDELEALIKKNYG